MNQIDRQWTIISTCLAIFYLMIDGIYANPPPNCPPHKVGLIRHPHDCSKFLNCDNGRTFIQNCAPGTHFNPKTQVCDMPESFDCTSENDGNDGPINSGSTVRGNCASGGCGGSGGNTGGNCGSGGCGGSSGNAGDNCGGGGCGSSAGRNWPSRNTGIKQNTGQISWPSHNVGAGSGGRTGYGTSSNGYNSYNSQTVETAISNDDGNYQQGFAPNYADSTNNRYPGSVPSNTNNNRCDAGYNSQGRCKNTNQNSNSYPSNVQPQTTQNMIAVQPLHPHIPVPQSNLQGPFRTQTNSNGCICTCPN